MRVSKPFGKRSSADNKELMPKVKYFLTFEGEKTEVQYFSGVANFKKELGINTLFTIVPLERHYEEISWSNPCKFIFSLIKTLEESSTGQMSIESIVKYSVDYIIDDLRLINRYKKNLSDFSEELYAKIEADFGYKREDIGYDQDTILECICEYLCGVFPHEFTEISIDNVQQYLSEQELYYNPEIDKVCLIVDRDPLSFFTDQYNLLVNACSRKNFSLYVSNPCFELWLLMHYSIVNELDPKMMLENNNRFLEKELKKQLPAYKKRKIHFDKLITKIDDAISNAQFFCEDTVKLESELGSNVSLLLKELRSDH